jgi:TPR repeat protein
MSGVTAREEAAFQENKLMSKTIASQDGTSQEAAAGNDAESLFELGMRHSTGRGVDQDMVTAHKWFNLAAMMGHEGALASRADLAREMTTEQVAEAQRQARAWLWSSRNAPAAAEPKPAEGQQQQQPAAIPIRPLYVRRRAEAMRSAKAYTRAVTA